MSEGKLILPSDTATYWNGGQLAGTLTKCGMNQLMPDKNNAQLVVTPQYAKGGDICDTVTTKWAKGSGGPAGDETGNLVIHGTQDPITQDNQAFPLGRNHGQENVVFGIPGNWIGRKPENGGNATEPMNNIAPCLTKADRHATAYSFDSLASNSMKSSNPHSGCREVDLAKTIDTTVPCPSKNQGGVAIVQSSAVAPTLRAGNGGGAVNQIVNTIPLNSMTMLGRPSDDLKPRMGLGVGSETDPQNTLTKNHHHAVCHQNVVRRLTPVECERLQGFPDNWTQIPYRNKAADLCPDGARYAACGNSMAVPVMRWIAQRIEKHLNEISHLNN